MWIMSACALIAAALGFLLKETAPVKMNKEKQQQGSFLAA
jgi:hypothetical protein